MEGAEAFEDLACASERDTTADEFDDVDSGTNLVAFVGHLVSLARPGWKPGGREPEMPPGWRHY